MDIIQKFGNAVSSMSLEESREGAQFFLQVSTSGERLLFFSDKKLPNVGTDM